MRDRTSNRVYEFAVLAATPVCGLLLAVGGIRPHSLEVAPDPIRVLWEFGLIVAGADGLLGVFWPGQLSAGLGIGLAAVLALGALAARYVIAVLVFAGEQAVVAASFVGAVALGSRLRSAEILGSLRRLVRMHHPQDDPCSKVQT
ncbi:hypothetical protein ACH4OY_24485 [Micromonospora rubida]|uniref:DUF4345 domain-containing protein n=1 Tax=Micromonospora rubida TaxID=2697657 RepID=A0ABW7SQ27_9ACTN